MVRVRPTGIKGKTTAVRANPTVAKSKIMATARRTTSAKTETKTKVASSSKEVIKSHTAHMAASLSTTRLLMAKGNARVDLANSSPAIKVSKTGTKRGARAMVKTLMGIRDLVPKLATKESLASTMISLTTTRTEVMAVDMVDRLLLTITLPRLAQLRRITLTQS